MVGGTVCFQGDGFDHVDDDDDDPGGNSKVISTKITEHSHLCFSIFVIFSFRSEPVCIFVGAFEE